MDPVAQLVGQRGHVLEAAVVVEKDVGVKAGDHPRAEGPAALARSRGHVDPAAVEEAAGDVLEVGTEAAEGVEDRLAGLVEGDGADGLGVGRECVVEG
ncbi:hypothetical protein D3C86_1133740 [compost metagenome]